MSRVILHSDCNAFYASVECCLNPSLQGKAVAVCGDAEARHGIVLAKNEAAKAFGVKTGEAIWQAKKKCPHLVTVNAQFARYLEFSERVRAIYADYTNQIEPFGLDEAWLDVTGSQRLFGSGMRIAGEIQRRVKKEIGITVSIGVSYNKVFAKLGSDYKKPDAITLITKENYRSLLWPLPADALLYVGKASKAKLASLGIYTIGELAASRLDMLQKNLGKWGNWLYSAANGMEHSPVLPYEYIRPPQWIGNSTTTVRDLQTLQDAKIVFSALADSVGRRMRKHSLCCRTVCISVRDRSLATYTRQIRLPAPTCITADIFHAAFSLFCKNHEGKQAVRALGLRVGDFLPVKAGIQLSLFEQEEKQRMRCERLQYTADGLKDRYGSSVLFPALHLVDQQLSGFTHEGLCSVQCEDSHSG